IFDHTGQPWWFLARLAGCCAADAAVGLALAFLALRMAHRAVLALAYALAAVALELAVVNVQVFHVYQRFLDPSLLRFATFGGHGYFREYTPPWFALALALTVPLAIAVERAFVRHWLDDWRAIA